MLAADSVLKRDKCIADLQKVSYLSLAMNCITEIDDLAFAPFKTLAKLGLQSNKISKISQTAFSGTKLTYLYLSTNKLKCVPDLYTVSQTLTYLDISDNEIENDERA